MSLVETIRLRAAQSGRAQLIADIGGYFGASAAALLLDAFTLAILNKVFRVGHLLAASVGFLAGLALVYWLSVSFVFSDRRRFGVRGELAGFLLTGLAGLALTTALMWLFVDIAGLPVLVGKVPTAGFVFLFNFVLRRTLIFAHAPDGTTK